MEKKTKIWLVLVLAFFLIGAVYIIAEILNPDITTGLKCKTTVVYQETDLTLIPVDTKDKAHEVIENAYLALNLTQYKKFYDIEHYENKNPDGSYDITIPAFDVRFTVLNDGTVKQTICAR